MYTYDVSWDMSEVSWASRWDAYLRMPGGRVHWFSILNSLMVVLVMSSIVAMIMMRTIRRDLARYEGLLGDAGAPHPPLPFPSCLNLTPPYSLCLGCCGAKRATCCCRDVVGHCWIAPLRKDAKEDTSKHQIAMRKAEALLYAQSFCRCCVASLCMLHLLHT